MEIGKRYEMSLVVEEHMLASKMNSGAVDVFATPMMIAFMEASSRLNVQEDIGEGNTTVGTLVNIKHLAATPKGMTVKFISTLTAVNGKFLTFDVEAFDEKTKTGEGIHERAIVNREKFEERTNAK